jgi:hypothetical protein
MPTQPHAPGISPGQASYVVERLLAERRISPSDVNACLADLAREIRDIEDRIATLRAVAGSDMPRPKTSPKRRVARRKRVGRPGRPSAMQLNGRYMGFYRQIPKYDQAKYSAIRKEQGIEAAIRAMRERLGK